MRHLLLASIGIFLIFGCQRPFGHNALVQEEIPESIEYPELSKVQDDEDAFQYYRLARLTFDQGNPEKALAYAKKAVQLEDENALYYYLLAQIFAALDQSDEALDNALKSYSLGYVNPELQMLISQQYYAEEELEKGKKFLDVVLKKKPDDPSVTFLKARMELQYNDTVSAINWLNRTLAIDSNYSTAIERKAQVLMAQNRIEEAINLHKKLIQLEPRNIRNLYSLGTLLMELGNYPEAGEWFRRVVQLDANHLTSYLQLSQIKLEMRQYDSARFYADIALQYDEAFNDARLIKARSYDRQYQYNAALEVYEDILSRDSTFEIAAIEMEQLLKKIAYLRRVRKKQDSIEKANEPAPVERINSENNND